MLIRHLSRTQHVKVSLNLRGPSRKAKYSLATDSEPSSASERWEEPRQGEDSEPETTCLQAVRARLLSLPLCVPKQCRVQGLECRMNSNSFCTLNSVLCTGLGTYSGGLGKGDGVPFA